MIRIIVYTVIALLVLSFFGISLQGIIEQPTTQANFQYVWNSIVFAATYLWNLIQPLVNLIPFISL